MRSLLVDLPDTIYKVAITEVTMESNSSTDIHCPKCHKLQSNRKECVKCGVLFDKVQQARRTAHTERTQREAKQNGFSFVALIAALIVGVVGAFLWKLIAVQSGYEFGLIAWVVGGAIGFAATVSGGRGPAIGVACAVITVVSIFAGKHMTVSHFYSEDFAAAIAADYDQMIIQEMYDESMVDAEIFSSIDKNDTAIKEFMADYGYSEAVSAESISDEELEYFQFEVQPFLEDTEMIVAYYDEIQGQFDTMQADVPMMAAALEEQSKFTVLIESLGILDLVFIVLGFSTAYRVGSEGHFKPA